MIPLFRLYVDVHRDRIGNDASGNGVDSGVVKRRVATNGWLGLLFVASTSLDFSNTFSHFIRVIELSTHLLSIRGEFLTPPLVCSISRFFTPLTPSSRTLHQLSTTSSFCDKTSKHNENRHESLCLSNSEPTTMSMAADGSVRQVVVCCYVP